MNAKATSGKSDQEESMEDILHSIRDIIAEEETAEDDALASIMDKTDPDPVDDVLELTDVVEGTGDQDVLADIDAALQEEPINIHVEPVEEVFEETLPGNYNEPIPAASLAAELAEPEPVVPLAQIVRPARSEPPAESLLSEQTARATENSLRSFIHNIPRPEIESPVFRGGNTLEDLVVETLKPMLSDWLDKNLATMVEDLVQREIRKLIPRE